MILILSIKGKRTRSGFTEDSREVVGEVPGDPEELQDVLADIIFDRMKQDGLLDEVDKAS